VRFFLREETGFVPKSNISIQKPGIAWLFYFYDKPNVRDMPARLRRAGISIS